MIADLILYTKGKSLSAIVLRLEGFKTEETGQSLRKSGWICSRLARVKQRNKGAHVDKLTLL